MEEVLIKTLLYVVFKNKSQMLRLNLTVYQIIIIKRLENMDLKFLKILRMVNQTFNTLFLNKFQIQKVIVLNNLVLLILLN
jgi:hypothetical protein